MANSHMTFGVDLLPKTTNTYALGNSNQKWKIYGDFAPLATKTYTDVIATENSNQGAGFFYLKVRGNSYNDKWYVKTRVFATVPGQELYETDTTFELWGYANTYSGYACMNKNKTSTRPIYYNCYFRPSSTGYDNNCGGWIGFSLYSATNPTSTSYKRTVTVELLDYQNCEIELQDSLITPDNIPNRATNTGWYSSTNTSFDNFDASSQGLKQSGDANTTNICNLYYGVGNYIANSALYRYQLLFHIDEDKLTPLNNNNNVTGTTKTILTDIEILPFEDIFYYNSTTTVSADGAINSSALMYSISGIDLRYTFNISTSALTAHKNVYLKLIPTTGKKAKLASATPLTQTLPSAEDGYLYLLLGRASDGYKISLYPKHPIYLCEDKEVTARTLYNDAPKLEFITSTNSSQSNSLTGTSTATSIADGKIIIFYNQYAITGQATLNLTLASSGNTTSAIPIYVYGSTRSETQYPAGSMIPLVYYNSKFYIIQSGPGFVD